MKRILYTQRVDVVERYHERRDCADQCWPDLLSVCGFLPLPVPNRPEAAVTMARELKPAGIVLTGGNSLAAYGGNADERDETERFLLDWAVAGRVPVLGVCRGMQMIHCYFGGKLEPVANHVCVRHSLVFEGIQRNVNSYHDLGILQAVEPFRADAAAEDGVIEAISHRELPIRAIMWHPERERPFSGQDTNLIKMMLGRESE